MSLVQEDRDLEEPSWSLAVSEEKEIELGLERVAAATATYSTYDGRRWYCLCDADDPSSIVVVLGSPEERSEPPLSVRLGWGWGELATAGGSEQPPLMAAVERPRKTTVAPQDEGINLYAINPVTGALAFWEIRRRHLFNAAAKPRLANQICTFHVFVKQSRRVSCLTVEWKDPSESPTILVGTSGGHIFWIKQHLRPSFLEVWEVEAAARSEQTEDTTRTSYWNFFDRLWSGKEVQSNGKEVQRRDTSAVQALLPLSPDEFLSVSEEGTIVIWTVPDDVGVVEDWMVGQPLGARRIAGSRRFLSPFVQPAELLTETIPWFDQVEKELPGFSSVQVVQAALADDTLQVLCNVNMKPGNERRPYWLQVKVLGRSTSDECVHARMIDHAPIKARDLKISADGVALAAVSGSLFVAPKNASDEPAHLSIPEEVSNQRLIFGTLVKDVYSDAYTMLSEDGRYVRLYAPKIPPPTKAILPPPGNGSMVLLDLDQTLIQVHELKDAENCSGVFESFVISFNGEEGHQCEYQCVLRPGLIEFLQSVWKEFDLVCIFTAGTKKYAHAISKLLEDLAKIKFDFVWHRGDCTKNGDDVYVKDLTKVVTEVGLDATRMILVDNNIHSFRTDHRDNGLLVCDFRGGLLGSKDKCDDTLSEVYGVLKEAFKRRDDVRSARLAERGEVCRQCQPCVDDDLDQKESMAIDTGFPGILAENEKRSTVRAVADQDSALCLESSAAGGGNATRSNSESQIVRKRLDRRRDSPPVSKPRTVAGRGCQTMSKQAATNEKPGRKRKAPPKRTSEETIGGNVLVATDTRGFLGEAPIEERHVPQATREALHGHATLPAMENGRIASSASTAEQRNAEPREDEPVLATQVNASREQQSTDFVVHRLNTLVSDKTSAASIASSSTKKIEQDTQTQEVFRSLEMTLETHEAGVVGSTGKTTPFEPQMAVEEDGCHVDYSGEILSREAPRGGGSFEEQLEDTIGAGDDFPTNSEDEQVLRDKENVAPNADTSAGSNYRSIADGRDNNYRPSCDSALSTTADEDDEDSPPTRLATSGALSTTTISTENGAVIDSSSSHVALEGASTGQKGHVLPLTEDDDFFPVDSGERFFDANVDASLSTGEAHPGSFDEDSEETKEVCEDFETEDDDSTGPDELKDGVALEEDDVCDVSSHRDPLVVDEGCDDDPLEDEAEEGDMRASKDGADVNYSTNSDNPGDEVGACTSPAVAEAVNEPPRRQQQATLRRRQSFGQTAASAANSALSPVLTNARNRALPPVQRGRKRKHTKKDLSDPKRPMSAFLHFFDEKRAEIREQNPQMGIKDVARVLGRKWNELSEKDKAPFEDKSMQDKKRYRAEKAEQLDRQRAQASQPEQSFYPAVVQPQNSLHTRRYAVNLDSYGLPYGAGHHQQPGHAGSPGYGGMHLPMAQQPTSYRMGQSQPPGQYGFPSQAGIYPTTAHRPFSLHSRVPSNGQQILLGHGGLPYDTNQHPQAGFAGYTGDPNMAPRNQAKFPGHSGAPSFAPPGQAGFDGSGSARM